MYRVIGRLSQNDLTVTIYGESGTGKELVAKALHMFGKRSDNPFIAVNMAAIPKDLIESELFGHEKGSFTGAHQKSDGKFKQAEKGTLFLDEIGDMPLDAQTRLLRVLQEGEYTSVGGKEKIEVDVRIIAATNKDLKKLIDLGIFREDLYYRLNVVPIDTPPLRDRIEDLPELIEHFLIKTEKSGLPLKKIDNDAIDEMKSYKWPGNVRELENTIERAVVLCQESSIQVSDLPHEIYQASLGGGMPNLREERQSLDPALFAVPMGTPLQEVERRLIMKTLAFTGGDKRQTAQLLGVATRTIYRKLATFEESKS